MMDERVDADDDFDVSGGNIDTVAGVVVVIIISLCITISVTLCLAVVSTVVDDGSRIN